MNTVILSDHTYDYKEFFKLNTTSLYNKKIYHKNNVFLCESINVIHVLPNSIVHVTPFSETDYELPLNPKIGDSVLFFIDPFFIPNNKNIHFDSFPKIKIYRNGKRIMGLEEHLICDRPFQSLRLSFYTEEDGWIIV